ncbi:MAG: response regulator [Thalassobaculum sp.]
MSHAGSARPVNILLVEDNAADVRLTVEAFKTMKMANQLYTVTNGDDALAFVRRTGEFADAPTPDIILLDLNMPGKDGRAVLKELKEDDKTKTIPVVIMTSSEAETDILAAYENHANCFVSKPLDFSGFARITNAIESFWFHIVVLPSEAKSDS